MSAENVSSNSIFSELLNRIESGDIRTLTQLDAYVRTVSKLDVSVYLSAIVRNTDDKNMISRIISLTGVAPALQKKLMAICTERGLFFPHTGPTFFAPARKKSFVSLKDKLPGQTVIAPDVIKIQCLQQETLFGGTETCGAHSFKNAASALAASRRKFIPESLFVSPDYYDLVAAVVFDGRRDSGQGGDVSVPYLRIAWRRNLHEASSFKGVKERDMSFFDTAGDQLALSDAESLESLANLKALTRHPGPCHHAVVMGGEGHWVALVYEKNAEGKVCWYGFDSQSESTGDFYLLESVRKLNVALANIDNIAPKLYYQVMGESLERLVPKIEEDKNTLRQAQQANRANLMDAMRFMKEMGWFDPSAVRPPLVEHWMHSLRQLCTFYQIRQRDVWPDVKPLDPFSYQLALLHSCGVNEKTINAFIHSILTVEQQMRLLKRLNDSHDYERAEQFEKVMELIETGYVELFTGEDFVQRWEDISNLIKMGVLPLPTSDPVVAAAFMAQYKAVGASLIEALNLWMQDPVQAEIKSSIVFTLAYALEHNTSAQQVRDLIAVVEKNIFLFTPYPDFFEMTLRDMKILTDEGALSLYSNPYRVYRELQELRKTQIPKSFYMRYGGEDCFFDPSIKEEIFCRGDISSHLTLDTFYQLFDAIEHRMRESLEYARNVYAVLSEIDKESSLEESFGAFTEAKNSFFNDPYMYSIMQLPRDPKTKIAVGSFKFYSLLNYWLSLDREPNAENPLGDQALTLLSYAKELYGCQTGRAQKIDGEYAKVRQHKPEALLPHPDIEKASQSDAAFSIQQRLWMLFQDVYMDYYAKVTSIMAQDVFLNEVLGWSKHHYIEQPTHITTYFLNKFGPLIGLPQELVFDRWTPGMDLKVFAVTEAHFMKIFLKHAEPIFSGISKLLGERVAEINHLMARNDSLMQMVVQYKKAGMAEDSAKQAALRQQIESEPQQENASVYERVDLESPQPLFSVSQDIVQLLKSKKIPASAVLRQMFRPDADEIMERVDYQPGDEVIQFICEEGGVRLLETLEILIPRMREMKIDSAQPIPLESFLQEVVKNSPLVIDLSGSVWLTKEDIVQVVQAAKKLELLCLRGCTQLTNHDIDGILAECEASTVVDLSECTQLSQLAIPIEQRLILNGCNTIRGLFKYRNGTKDLIFEIESLESGKKYDVIPLRGLFK